jgi:hypothetical protein
MADISDNGSFNASLANIQSQNYGPTATTNQANTAANTAQQQATTAQTQQATQAQAMQNQILKARLPFIMAGLHGQAAGADDQSGVSGRSGSGGSGSGDAAIKSPTPPADDVASQDSSATPPDQNFYQPDKIDTALRGQFFVPTVTAQEQKQLALAYARDPTDQYGLGPKSVMAQQQFRIARDTQQCQVDARDLFDKMSAVTDAPDGNAMDVLEASHPDTVAAIRRQFAKDPSAAMDEDSAARMYASHVAGAVHQYTGRKAEEGKDGVYRDEATQLPIPGVEKVGLSTDQYVKLAHDAITPSVDMPDGNGGSIKVAPWKAAQMSGAKNINGPGDWMMVQASQRQLPGGASTLSPNSAQKQEAHKVAQAALSQVQKQQASAPAPTNGAPAPVNGVGAARNAQGNIDQPLTEALHDTKYDYKPTLNGTPYTAQVGRTPPPSVMEDMKNQTEARNDLAKTSNEGVGSAAAALTMYKAAQDVLAKGNYDGGAWNARLAQYAKWMPAGWETAVNNKAGDYQEVAKYLGNAALQSGKGIFSKMTEKESEAVMHDLNPAPGMTTPALNDMISRGVSTAQFSLDSAKRVPAYLHAGKDANQFPSWNQEHFPMQEATKTQASVPPGGSTTTPSTSAGAKEGATSTSKSGKPIIFSAGHWQYK